MSIVNRTDDFEGLIGKSMFKSAKGLTNFQDLLDLSFKNPFSVFELNHAEKDWENIPFILPQSIITLEKRLVSLQTWGKAKDDEIQALKKSLETKEIFKKIDGFDSSLKKDAAAIDDIQSRMTRVEQILEYMSANPKLKSIPSDLLLKATNERPKSNIKSTVPGSKQDIDQPQPENTFLIGNRFLIEQKDRDSLSKFFGKVEHIEEHEVPEHQAFTSQFIEDDEYNDLRKFNIKQIRYLIFQYLNRSVFRQRLEEIDARTKSSDPKHLEELKTKLNKYVSDQIDKLEGMIDKNKEDLEKYIDEKAMKQIEATKRRIHEYGETMEEFKGAIRENKKFGEGLSQKIEKLNMNLKGYSSHVETKISKLEEEFKKNLAEYAAKTDNTLTMLDKELKRLSLQAEEVLKGNQEFIEEFLSSRWQKLYSDLEEYRKSATKNFNVLASETELKLDKYRIELDKLVPAIMGDFKKLDRKIEKFIEHFEDYSKTKIEPAFKNQAKIHVIETRLTTLETTTDSSYTSTKDFLKKLVYALQMHNAQPLKNAVEKDIDNKTSHDGSRKDSIHYRDSGHISELNISFDQNMTRKENDLPPKVFTPYGGWEPRGGIRSLSHQRKEKPRLLLDLVPNATGYVLPQQEQLSAKQSQSFVPRRKLSESRLDVSIAEEGKRDDMVEVGSQANIPESRVSERKEQQSFIQPMQSTGMKNEPTQATTFDAVFHKRLEILRAMLFKDEKEQIGYTTAQTKMQSKLMALKTYKDLDLVTYEGKRRKPRQSNQILEQATRTGIAADFGDSHMLNNSVL